MALADHFVEGFRRLRTAATLKLAASALAIATAALLLPSLLTFAVLLSHLRTPGQYPPTPSDVRSLLAALAFPGLLALATLLLNAIATYAFLIPSSSKLARWREKLTTPSKLLKIGYWGALIAGLLAAAIAAVGLHVMLSGYGLRSAVWRLGAGLLWLLAGAGVGIFALLLAFIGWVGLVMLLLELSSATKVEGFKVAAILMVLSAALTLLALAPSVAVLAGVASSALDLISWYFVRSSSGEALLPPPPPPS